MADQVLQAGFTNIIADFLRISDQLKQGGFGPFHSLNIIIEEVELHNALSYQKLEDFAQYGFFFGCFFPSFTAVAYHLNNRPHPKSQENENSTDASS